MNSLGEFDFRFVRRRAARGFLAPMACLSSVAGFVTLPRGFSEPPPRALLRFVWPNCFSMQSATGRPGRGSPLKLNAVLNIRRFETGALVARGRFVSSWTAYLPQTTSSS